MRIFILTSNSSCVSNYFNTNSLKTRANNCFTTVRFDVLSVYFLFVYNYFGNKSSLFTDKHELCRLSQKKLPWVHNKHNWMSTNLVIFFSSQKKDRGMCRNVGVLTLVLMKICVFSYVTSYSLAGIYQYREENYCFNLQT